LFVGEFEEIILEVAHFVQGRKPLRRKLAFGALGVWAFEKRLLLEPERRALTLAEAAPGGLEGP